jgi:deoxycytidine triphosphate deaminase
MAPHKGPLLSPAERERLRRQDLDEAAHKPADHQWPPEITDPEVSSMFWDDPHPEHTAVLTADLIREYHYGVGRMIRPFQEEHLNSASYDLTLGPRCLVDGEEKILSERSPIVRIPPGSIALAPSREMLFIPHWLVATFNLKSHYIFKGLLMGIGPQIDPGYMGVLTCPLHNVSCEPIDLHFCKPFAKLDFIRTSWGTTVDLSGIGDEDELYERAQRGQLTGFEGTPVPLWPRAKRFRQPLITGREPAGVKGSLGDLKEQVKRFGKRLNWGFGGGLALAVTTIAAVVGVGTLAFLYTESRVSDSADDAVRAARAETRTALRELGYPERVRGSGQRDRGGQSPTSVRAGDSFR